LTLATCILLNAALDQFVFGQKGIQFWVVYK
jgi:hypothetical protein